MSALTAKEWREREKEAYEQFGPEHFFQRCVLGHVLDTVAQKRRPRQPNVEAHLRDGRILMGYDANRLIYLTHFEMPPMQIVVSVDPKK